VTPEGRTAVRAQLGRGQDSDRRDENADRSGENADRRDENADRRDENADRCDENADRSGENADRSGENADRCGEGPKGSARAEQSCSFPNLVAFYTLYMYFTTKNEPTLSDVSQCEAATTSRAVFNPSRF
jgi:hypothetical protein